MKKLLLLLTLFSAYQSNAQDPCRKWQWKNPTPVGINLSDTYFTDANTGYAVGTLGTIIKTTDGGDHWQPLLSGTTLQLNAVHFSNDTTGYVVGYDGILLTTTDAGMTWSSTTLISIDLYDIYFPDENNGWISGSGGLIYKTSDGGNSWSQQLTTTWTNAPMYAVYFTDSLNGWISSGVSSPYIFHTSDGGATWNDQTTISGWQIFDVFFINNTTGWAVGYNGLYYKTTDGGTNWNAGTSGVTTSLRKILFTDLNTGWAVGDDGVILHTTNGGTTWSSQTSNSSNDIMAISGENNNLNFVGANGAHGNSTNLGTTWSLTSGTELNISDISFYDTLNAVAVGYEALVMITEDAGNTWEILSSSIAQDLEKVHTEDSTHCWAIGGSTDILFSNDGGISWQTQYIASQYIHSIYFSDTLHGWAGSFNGKLYRTVDGGDTWQTITTGNNSLINDIYFIDDQEGWITGGHYTYGSFVYHTTNGGLNWAAQTLPSGITDYLWGIQFIDANEGWAVGKAGTIIHTTNGGTTWSFQTSNSTNVLNDVYFSDSNNGIAVGYYGDIVETTNGGSSWTLQPNFTYSHLNSIVENNGNYFMSGDNGVLIAETDKIALISNIANPLCNDDMGSAMVNMAGGTAPITYNWSNSETTAIASALTDGYTTISLSDADGCTLVDSVLIVTPSPIGTSVITSDVNCYGEMNGVAMLTLSGGTGSLTEDWGSADPLMLPAGYSTYTITDDNGCTLIDSVLINEPDSLELIAVIGNEVNGNDGTIDLSVTGGTGSYSYAWNNAESTEDLSNLDAGSYSVTVTDANGCENELTVTVESQLSVSSINGESLIVYPNPTNGTFVISGLTKEPANCQIYTVDGKKIKECTVSLPHTFELSQKGIYLLVLNTSDGKHTHRLVVE